MAQNLSQLQPLTVLNLRDHVEQQIRNLIVSGVLELGERLVESAIADRLGVSRAPVREALAVLQQEGLVVHIPRHGYFVVDFTDKDIEEVYSLRLLLEVEALQRTIERASEQDLAEMQRLVDDLGEAALQKNDPETIVALDMSFHKLICRVADHSRLCSAWDRLRLQTQLLIGLTSKTHYNYPDQPKELHQRILDAIRDRDLKRAAAVLTDHMLDAQRRATVALEGLHSGDKEQNS